MRSIKSFLKLYRAIKVAEHYSGVQCGIFSYLGNDLIVMLLLGIENTFLVLNT